LKLAENDGWHKRFSIGQIKSATFRSREGLLSAYRLVEIGLPLTTAGLEAARE
jgi:hypothetical protein